MLFCGLLLVLVGIVFRNDKGTIVHAELLGIQERRLNEFYAILYGLRKAFFEKFNLIELESDHVGAYWEWRFEHFDGVIPEHQYVVRQIKTRKFEANREIDLDEAVENENEDGGIAEDEEMV
ncbi:hypothetical protein POM88_016203 [Heracleum sosnowskyi]|uniref:RNase H type-1 domain-containing protein n=1 Tax=Heracleum sosnowskyi TaxID=360622 RepID=A0AAD8ILP9_9APIA|nr:hypothetical protein POM88_016203 [Heracleum sosnowskyi]